ncbi:transglutaminase-like putative cysteine protease [Pseudomonas sp. TE3786]
MSAVQPIPRVSLLWLLVAQALVIIPHLEHLPPWIIALWLVCAGWRVQIYRMRAQYPATWLKSGLTVGIVGGVFLSRGSLIGLDAGVVLLIAAFILKLVEMRSRRDALVLILLGFFAVVTVYLFDDRMTTVIFTLLPVMGLLAALIGLQQSPQQQSPWPTLKLAGGMLAQALPLMVLLFLFFPRFGPLWSLPMPENQAVTGLSDSMAPNDIAELSRSDALAFRASFDGPLPPRSQQYWRALTLDQFEGRRWSQSLDTRFAREPNWTPKGEPLKYRIIMEASHKPWLFALDLASSELEDARLMGDFRLERRMPVDQTLVYRVTSWPEALREPQASKPALRRAMQLPKDGNPQSRAWAQQLKDQYPEPQALVQALLQHFNREPYSYTLRPPAVGEDSVDDFLFDTRAGFCEHYAGAMAYVLRAAGIPARVVAGYQGGELNRAGQFIQVRQFDAHAWVEYWREGVGWTTVDPTFQVAPDRIQRGLEEAMAGEQSFLENSPLSLLRYRHINWVNQLRLSWEELNYGWQRWVLDYQQGTQLELLQQWFGRLDSRDLVLSLVGGGGAVLMLIGLWLFKPWRRERDVQQRLYQRFERLLAKHGVRRQPGEGARAFARRAELALPAQLGHIRAFADAFEAQRYGGTPVSPQTLQRHVRALRRALPLRWMQRD